MDERSDKQIRPEHRKAHSGVQILPIFNAGNVNDVVVRSGKIDLQMSAASMLSLSEYRKQKAHINMTDKTSKKKPESSPETMRPFAPTAIPDGKDARPTENRSGESDN